MNTQTDLKNIVKEKYTSIATQENSQPGSACCDASGCCTSEDLLVMADDYSSLEGYNPDADLSLGCGIPTVHANLKPGDTVIDLGSGAGNDVFIAARQVQDKGKVIGVDFTEAMITKARQNAEKIGSSNVEFRLGDIESLPVTSNLANVVLSNCVLNLVPNKHKVFSEIFRVLKPGGHFAISDIVLKGELPASLKTAAELYAGCVSGAIQKSEYLAIISEAGFKNIVVQKEKKINVPDQVLLQYASQDEVSHFKNVNPGIFSITVTAKKIAKDERNCCEPGSGCC